MHQYYVISTTNMIHVSLVFPFSINFTAATYLRVEQDEPFFNIDFDYLTNDFQEDQSFFQQLYGHHFDGDDAPTDDTFEDESNW